MQTKTIYYKGRIYQKVAVCFFIGAKMQVVFCSEEDEYKQDKTIAKAGRI